ncbi:MAG: hypothetical protein ACFE94_18535 [Candidatus Hodarchaeota archaeon]
MIIIYSIYFFNLSSFTPSEDPDSIKNDIFIIISQFLLFTAYRLENRIIPIKKLEDLIMKAEKVKIT